MHAIHQTKIVDPDFPFKIFLTNSPFSFYPHWHKEIELLYVKEGICEVGLNNQKYLLQPRDILIIGSGDIHYFIANSGENKKRGQTVFIQFGLSFLDPVYSLRDMKILAPLLRHTHQVNNEENVEVHDALESLILQLLHEYTQQQQAYQLVVRARVYDILAALIRHIPLEKYTTEEKTKLSKQLERLDKVFEYVDLHYSTPITLSKISEVANFSMYHFARFFKSATGMTFNQYMNHYRIKKAEWLLSSTSESITEVSFQSGFSSIKTFNRVFKQIKGCSPSQYKKNTESKM